VYVDFLVLHEICSLCELQLVMCLCSVLVNSLFVYNFIVFVDNILLSVFVNYLNLDPEFVFTMCRK